MQSLLDRHSDLRRAFDKRILSAPSRTELGQVKKSRLNHVRWFLDELRKLGYEQRIEWPFNTENTSYQTVCRYLDALLQENPKMAEIGSAPCRERGVQYM